MLFQTSAAEFPFTIDVVAIAPGFTSEFISGPPSDFCENSIETIELKRIPVASTPIVFSIFSGPCSSITFAMVKTLEMDWIETSVLMSPAV